MNVNSPQQVAKLIGIVFIAVGVLGFIPGVTSHASDIKFSGHNSPAELLGTFQVSILHNVVHILFGLAGLGLAKTMGGARQYLIGGGVVYLALFVLGILNGADWIPANDADNWLHLGLGVGLIGLGVMTTGGMRAKTA